MNFNIIIIIQFKILANSNDYSVSLLAEEEKKILRDL